MKQKTKNEIQNEALTTLFKSNGVGTVVLDTGVGKCKVLIDFILQKLSHGDTVLITVPTENLIENWINEITKWTTCERLGKLFPIMQISLPDNGLINVIIKTIQSVYNNDVKEYTLLALDEIHMQTTEVYSNIFDIVKSKFVIGLTATPDISKRPDKFEIYEKFCPIIYEYYSGEKDGILNKTKITVINHWLNDDFKVMVGKKDAKFPQGELSAYSYWTKQIEEGQKLMAIQGSDDFFMDAKLWGWNKQGNYDQKKAAMHYLNAITKRRKLLISLTSTATIANVLAKTIVKENDVNKVLVFTEEVDQIKRICKYCVHGKQKDDLNTSILEQFNEGLIRAIGSCNTIGTGMNLIGATHMIVTDFVGSSVKLKQRIGRMHRLDVNDTAYVYIIRVQNTQNEKWFKEATKDINIEDAEYVESTKFLTN